METMLDVFVNQTFRRDLWSRGRRPVWSEEQRNFLLNQKIILLNEPLPLKEGDNPYKFTTSLGEVTGKYEVYAPLYDSLKHGPKTLRELMNLPVINQQGPNKTGQRTLPGLHFQNPKYDAQQLGQLWAERLAYLGRGLFKDGQPLTTLEAMTPRAVELADVFLTKTLPQWQKFGVL